LVGGIRKSGDEGTNEAVKKGETRHSANLKPERN
jgi:hypothetical protein